MKGEDRRWCVNDGWSRRWKSFSMHSCGSNVSRLDAYERFLARFSCVRHLEWGLATNRGGHARGRTWISPPASFDVPGRSEVRGTAILRDRSGSQVALWLENRRCAGVGITLFHVRSPGELLSLSPVTMHAYDCRDVASIQIFYVYIYIYLYILFSIPHAFYFPFFYLFIFRIIFGWLIFEQGQISHLDSLGTRSQFTTFIRETDRYAMGKKKKAENQSLYRDCGGHRFRIYFFAITFINVTENRLCPRRVARHSIYCDFNV